MKKNIASVPALVYVRVANILCMHYASIRIHHAWDKKDALSITTIKYIEFFSIALSHFEFYKYTYIYHIIICVHLMKKFYKQRSTHKIQKYAKCHKQCAALPSSKRHSHRFSHSRRWIIFSNLLHSPRLPFPLGFYFCIPWPHRICLNYSPFLHRFITDESPPQSKSNLFQLNKMQMQVQRVTELRTEWIKKSKFRIQ